MKKELITSVLMTLALTLLVGIIYPLAVTAVSQLAMPDKANGQLILVNGKPVGSRIIGQPFTGQGYFHSRISAAGAAGYDASNSSATNYGPTNKALVDRVQGDVKRVQTENPSQSVPVDLVTSSGSGLDPHITPAAAEFQVQRVARERNMKEDDVRQLIKAHTEDRQFGVLGEARVNVLELNLALDAVKK